MAAPQTTALARNDVKRPVSAHITELRNAIIICAVVIALASIGSFFFFDQLVTLFQQPLGQRLFYTSPTGGISFVLKLCTAVGAVITIPVVVNRMFAFVRPAVSPHLHRSIAWYSIWSIIMAAAGVTFAYMLSMPAALHFLTDFNSGDIKALITVDSYFSFFIAYLVGYAILFQTPIIMLFINRIKPLKPSDMMKYERHLIGGAFVVAAFLTPTPDPWNQGIMAAPIIILYQVGILLVWRANRRLRKQPVVVTVVQEGIIEMPVAISYQEEPAELPVPRLNIHRLVIDVIPPTMTTDDGFAPSFVSGVEQPILQTT